MSSNHLKTPLAQSLNVFTDQKIAAADALEGKALPCHIVAVGPGACVTIAFDVKYAYPLPTVTVPVATSKYVREPLQIGDVGVVFSADVYLCGAAGLGGGIPRKRG